MTFEQQWIEYDFNPFLLFNVSGKVVSLNAEAQFLLGAIDHRLLYELATTYASPSFGFRTTFLDLEFGRFRFFGITVGYESEEEIGIRLYQMPTFKFTHPEPGGELVNVYTLIDLCISSNSIGSKTRYKKDLDPSIPEIRLQPDNFIRLLNKIYAGMKGSHIIRTKLFFRVGEYIRYEENKYTFFSLLITGEKFNTEMQPEIEQLCRKNHFVYDLGELSISLNIPVIS